MAAIKYAEEFFANAASITSAKLQGDLKRTLLAITDFPEIGSTNVPSSIQAIYGCNVRKMVIGPFDLIYEWTKAEEQITVHGLIHVRAAR